jgi:hypothetical protein
LEAPRTQATPEPAGRRGKQGRKNPALSLTTPRPATEGVAKPDARWAFSKDVLSGDRELADFVAALETLAPVRTAGVAQPEPANEPGNSSKRPDAWQALAMTPQPRWPQLESAAIQTAPSSPDPVLVPVASTKASTPERGKKKGTKKRRAAQDEWGMYDPEQCGISALMAKLDELEENEEDD